MRTEKSPLIRTNPTFWNLLLVNRKFEGTAISETGSVPSNNESNANGDDEQDQVEGFISWPKKGKHLSFDGRYLHAAPHDFMTNELFLS